MSVSACALGACGGDDSDSGSNEPVQTTDDTAAIEQDTQAKMNARTLVTYVETCYVDSQDYSKCLDAGAGDKNIGRATVEAPSSSHFVVTAPSESGNEFEVANTEGGGLVRNCTERGEAGCSGDGSW